MIAQCTCKPSSPAVMCPIEEHRTRAEMARLRVVGARPGPFVHHAAGPPNPTRGMDGDSYIDTTALCLYGPKGPGGWGEGVALVGEPEDACE